MSALNFTGLFGGASRNGNVYTFPSSAESWAGYANSNTDMYPLTFTNGGSLTFDYTNNNDDDVKVKMKLEYQQHPITEPSWFSSEYTLVANTSDSITIDIPSQGSNTFSSLLLFIVDRDLPVTLTNFTIYDDPPYTLEESGSDVTINVHGDLNNTLVDILAGITDMANKNLKIIGDNSGSYHTWTDFMFNYSTNSAASLHIENLSLITDTIDGYAVYSRNIQTTMKNVNIEGYSGDRNNPISNNFVEDGSYGTRWGETSGGAMRIRGADYGDGYTSNTITLENVSVSHCCRGIRIQDTTGAYIVNCSATNVSDNGIYFASGSYTSSLGCHNCVVENCDVSGAGQSGLLNIGGTYNRFINCNVKNTRGTGVHVWNTNGTCIVDNCEFTNAPYNHSSTNPKKTPYNGGVDTFEGAVCGMDNVPTDVSGLMIIKGCTFSNIDDSVFCKDSIAGRFVAAQNTINDANFTNVIDAASNETGFYTDDHDAIDVYVATNGGSVGALDNNKLFRPLQSIIKEISFSDGTNDINEQFSIHFDMTTVYNTTNNTEVEYQTIDPNFNTLTNTINGSSYTTYPDGEKLLIFLPYDVPENARNYWYENWRGVYIDPQYWKINISGKNWELTSTYITTPSNKGSIVLGSSSDELVGDITGDNGVNMNTDGMLHESVASIVNGWNSKYRMVSSLYDTDNRNYVGLPQFDINSPGSGVSNVQTSMTGSGATRTFNTSFDSLTNVDNVFFGVSYTTAGTGVGSVAVPTFTLDDNTLGNVVFTIANDVEGIIIKQHTDGNFSTECKLSLHESTSENFSNSTTILAETQMKFSAFFGTGIDILDNGDGHILTYPFKSSNYYKLILKDTYGDGWNGNTIKVFAIDENNVETDLEMTIISSDEDVTIGTSTEQLPTSVMVVTTEESQATEITHTLTNNVWNVSADADLSFNINGDVYYKIVFDDASEISGNFTDGGNDVYYDGTMPNALDITTTTTPSRSNTFVNSTSGVLNTTFKFDEEISLNTLSFDYLINDVSFSAVVSLDSGSGATAIYNAAFDLSDVSFAGEVQYNIGYKIDATDLQGNNSVITGNTVYTYDSIRPTIIITADYYQNDTYLNGTKSIQFNISSSKELSADPVVSLSLPNTSIPAISGTKVDSNNTSIATSDNLDTSIVESLNATLASQGSLSNMGIVGYFNGWSTDILMYNINNTNTYCLYAIFPDVGTNEIKFRTNYSWAQNWGENGNGTLLSGGSNITVQPNTLYKITMDTDNLSYTLEVITYNNEHYYYNTPLSFDGSANGVQVKIDGAVTDLAGNTNSGFKFTSVFFDNINPICDIMIDDNNLLFRETATVTLDFLNFSANDISNQKNNFLTNVFTKDNVTITDGSGSGTFGELSLEDDISYTKYTCKFVPKNVTIQPNVIIDLSYDFADIAENELRVNQISINIDTLSNAICFVKGTFVETDQGNVEIQNIIPGKHTIGNKEIQHITKSISPENQLVYIKKNAFGKNKPNKNMKMSGKHKIKCANGCLIEAKALVATKPKMKFVEYNQETLYNVLMKDHNVIKVQNVEVESLDPENIVAKIYNSIMDKKELIKFIRQMNEGIRENNRETYICAEHEIRNA